MSPTDRSARPSGLLLVLAAACNLRCSYCYQDAHPDRRMRWSTIDQALDVLLGTSRRSSSIAFYGGEPLLAFALVRRTVEEAESRRPRGHRLRFDLSTNGLLLDSGKARFLEEHEIRTQVSFDGSRSAQDLRAKGTFARVARVLRKLRRDHPVLHSRLLDVAITVSPAAVTALAESVDTLLGWGMHRIILAPADTPGREWGEGDEQELDRQLGRIYDRSLDLYERTGRVPVTLFRRGSRSLVTAPRREMCDVANGDTLAVDVDGEAFGCPALVRSYQTLSGSGLRRFVAPLGIGPITSPDLERRLHAFQAAVHKSPLFGQWERKRSPRGRCAECLLQGECLVCPVAIARCGNEPHNVPAFLCSFNRLSLTYRERFPPQFISVPNQG